jgi:hypothetical protein
MANRQRDLGKERMWRALIARQPRSSQSVPVFCAARGLPPSALYAWRRIIAQRDRATATTTASTNPVDRESEAIRKPVLPEIRSLWQNVYSSNKGVYTWKVSHGSRIPRI